MAYPDNRYMEQDKKHANRIIRKDGKGVFLEVVNDAFEISKVKFSFRAYDKGAQAGNRTTAKVDYYLSFSEAALLCETIRSGKMEELLETSKQGANAGGHISPAWMKYSGANQSGQTLSRRMGLSMGAKILFTGEVGPGVKADGGIVKPAGAATNRVTVAMTMEDLLEIVCAIEMHMRAYLASWYVENPIKRHQDYPKSSD